MLESISGEKIKYVHIEVIYSRDNKHDVTAGLFKGILEHGGKKFILTSGLKEHVTNCVNTEFYKILKIEHMQDDFRTMLFFRAEKVDQDKGDEILERLYNVLKEAGRVMKDDSKIIDISTYTEVPTDLKPGSSATNIKAAGGTSSFVAPINRYSNTGTTVAASYTKTVIKKDPEPFFFKRKKIQKELVESLQQKMDQLRAGEYQPQLPEMEDADNFGNDKDNDVYGLGHTDYGEHFYM